MDVSLAFLASGWHNRVVDGGHGFGPSRIRRSGWAWRAGGPERAGAGRGTVQLVAEGATRHGRAREVAERVVSRRNREMGPAARFRRVGNLVGVGI